MTSKISFFKMVLNDSKRRLWLFIIVAVGFLLALPLTGAIVLGYEKANVVAGHSEMVDVYRNIKEWFATISTVAGVGVVGGAVLSAFSGFDYLYKKTKLDVFHSIPMKREKLFFVQYISGIVNVVVPVIISYLLVLVVWLTNDVITTELVLILFKGLGFSLLHFLMYYNVAILAIMLTGKIMVGILGMLVLWGYMPILYILVRGLYERFFYTYHAASSLGEQIFGRVLYVSPVAIQSVQLTVSNQEYGYEDVINLMAMTMIIEVVIILAALGGAILIYRKRSSESAGWAMAFPKIMPIIKILLMIVISIGTGLFLGLVADVNYDVWFAIGLALGLVISQGVIAVVYTGDISKIFSGKKSFGIATVCVLLIVIIFRFDVFGYDRYKPSPDKVESVAVSINGINDSFDIAGSGLVQHWSDGEIKDAPVIYDIVQKGIANAADKKGGKNTMDLLGTRIDANPNDMQRQVAISFKMNNGMKVYRRYEIDIKELETYLVKLYEAKGFKESKYPVLSLDAASVGKLFIIDLFDKSNSSGEYIEGDYRQIIEAYKADLLELTFADIKESNIVGALGYSYLKEDEKSEFTIIYSEIDNYSNVVQYPIYQSFQRTIKELNALGYKMAGEFEPENISEITLSKYDETQEVRSIAVITDKNEIEQILACGLIMENNGFYRWLDEYQTVEVAFEARYGGQREYYSIRTDLPTFVEERFEYEETSEYQYGEIEVY